MKRNLVGVHSLAVLLVVISLAAHAAEPAASPRVGVWSVEGRDTETWRGEMVIRNGRNGYTGYFEWIDENGEIEGKEHFTGVYDRKTGTLKLRGLQIEGDQQSLAVGEYTARLSEDGMSLIAGEWTGVDAEPGTWSARWKRAEKK